ncbi:glycosyltransferase family 2 protein [Leptothoe spongobia]|uniref:glycosyltransferase family 2 protein n=1 Tax=Leptothoe spongobia TaxID=2651728 RepID=UPI002DD61E46|nr:glycosyltransferase family 2 protein [Leptothoe spongobia]
MVESLAVSVQVVEVLLAAALVLPCAVLFIEVLVAFVGRGRLKRPQASLANIRRAILMPAHNEEAVIQATLSTLTSQLKSTDRLVVVADNCTDATAEIARQAGATVLEREDDQQRGKGYALDFGIRYLSQDAPDVLMMVDADCQVKPGSIDAIANLALTTNRPVQATYLLEQSPNPSPKEMVSTFAFKVKNQVRPLGLRILGQPCLLTGTGMAFPWATLKEVDLASGNIVEDMKLGLDLAIAGHSPIMCPNALVTGDQPQQDSTAMTQRTRWEHGHLQTLLTCVPPLLWQGLKQGRIGLIALALDLCVPPLSLLVMLWVSATVVITAMTLLLATTWLPAITLYGAGLSLLVAIGLAWSGFARQDISLGKLLSIPFYILWKIPLYFKFLKGPEAQWIRTDRES